MESRWTKCEPVAYISLAMILTAPRLPALRLSIVRFRGMVLFCAPIIVHQLSSQGIARLFLVAISYWHGVAYAGYWGVATWISEGVATAAAQATYSVALAYFASLQSSRERLVDALTRAQRAAMMCAIPSLAALSAASGPFVDLVLGVQWAPAAYLLQGPIFGTFLLVRRMFPLTALRSVGQSRVTTTVAAADGATAIVGLLVAGPMSAMATAAVYGLSLMPGYLVTSKAVANELKSSYATELRELAKDLCFGLVAVVSGRAAGNPRSDLLVIRSNDTLWRSCLHNSNPNGWDLLLSK